MASISRLLFSPNWVEATLEYTNMEEVEEIIIKNLNFTYVALFAIVDFQKHPTHKLMLDFHILHFT